MKTFPIKLYDKKGKEIIDYYGFSITGRCGPTYYEKAGIIEKRLVPTGPVCKYYKGRHVGLDQWDGCDFFMPQGTHFTIVTNKAAEVLKKNKITKLILRNLRDIETNVRSVLSSTKVR